MSTTPLSRIRVILPLLCSVALCLPGALCGAQSGVPAVPGAATPDERALPNPATIHQPPLAQPSDDDQTSHPQVTKAGPRVAMIDFESTTLPLDQIKAISQAMYARLDALPGVVMLPRGATRRWLIRHDLFPFTPYMRPAPAMRITEALKADYLITGHLDKLDGLFNLDVSVFSDRGNRYLVKDVKLQKDDLDALLPGLFELNRQLYRAIEEDDAGLTVSPITLTGKGEKKPAPEPEKSKTGTSKSGTTKKGSRKTDRTAEPGSKGETPRVRSEGQSESDERPFRSGGGKTPDGSEDPGAPGPGNAAPGGDAEGDPGADGDHQSAPDRHPGGDTLRRRHDDAAGLDGEPGPRPGAFRGSDEGRGVPRRAPSETFIGRHAGARHPHLPATARPGVLQSGEL